MDTDSLKRFLVELPEKLDYKNHGLIRQNLFRAIYYAATDKGRYLPYLFPNIRAEEVEDLEKHWSQVSNITNNEQFFNYKYKRNGYSHAKGSICSRPFKEGDLLYRCEQCGYDSTCVLCSYCFNMADHGEHNVTMYVSSGSGGGVCDCGDEDAFVTPLHCKCQTKNSDGEFMSDMLPCLRETMRVCLNYILDVTNFSIKTLPFIHKGIDMRGNLMTSKFVSNYSSLPSGSYGGAKDNNSDNIWYLVLWNDEYHNVEEAATAIKAATKFSNSKAREYTEKVNKQGFCVLLEAKKYEDLFTSKTAVESNGLIASIISARDLMRETIINHMFQWLIEITEIVGPSEFNTYSRAVLGDVLLETDYRVSKVFPAEFLKNLSINVQRRCFENGLLYDGDFVNLGLCAVKPDLQISELTKPTNFVLQPTAQLDRIEKSRIQYLLAFQIRFPMIVRKKLSKLLIPPLISEVKKKAIFCQHFTSIYPLLINCMVHSEREEQLNLLPEITTQLLTCPSSISWILESGRMSYLMGPVAQIIEENSSRWDYDSGYPNFVEGSTPAVKKTVSCGIESIVRLLDKSIIINKHPNLLSKQNIIIILMFLRIFQGYWPIEKKYGEHVEREVVDFFVHVQYSIPVLTIAKIISTSIPNPYGNPELLNAINLVIDFLKLRHIKQQAPGIADFKVSKEKVSFINAINSFLSYMIQLYGIDNYKNTLLKLNKSFFFVSDISLRSIVLAAQVKTGFWIRNGFSVSKQASLYSDSIMSDLSYFRDLHLNQIAALSDDPKITLYNFLDRWELLSWFANEVSHDKTIYEERFSAIAEHFIIFLYNTLTERSNFQNLGNEERLKLKAKRAICYALCDEPKNYTLIRSQMDEDVNELSVFDEILYECASYQAPNGLMDSGMYRLKSNLYQDLDPLSIHLDSNKFQSVSDSLIKNVAKTNGIREEDVILYPTIGDCTFPFVSNSIGRFLKTKDGSKLLYKLLSTSIDTSDETYLPQLLHLIHAIILDDEKIHGPNYLSENFVDIPISDLLLTIVDSAMSKAIVKKADFLVDQFISKDQRIIDSLVDCFGEEYISTFKKRKTDLSDSESDRRKREAEKRKTKVMKKFAKQRQKFIDTMKTDEKEATVDLTAKNDNPNDLRTCVLCGEAESFNESFGILVSKTLTSTFWKIPESESLHTMLAFKPLNEQTSSKSKNEYGGGYRYDTNRTPLNNASYFGDVTSTCGHGIHYSCYKNASNRSRYFPCPLCHNLHNVFIPSFIAPSDVDDSCSDMMTRDPLASKYNQILYSTSKSKSHELSKCLIDDGYFENAQDSYSELIKPILEDLFPVISNTKYLVGISKADTLFNNLQNMSNIIADTIRMNEISLRLDGEESLWSFLTELPGSVFTLLKSLIQCRSILFKYSGKTRSLDTEVDLSIQVHNFWNSEEIPDSVFNEFVSLFFQTDESFLTLARLCYTKLLTITLYSLVERCSLNSNYSSYFSSSKIEINREICEALKLVIELLGDQVTLPSYAFEDTFVSSLYFSVERIMLPFLRQLIIFKFLLESRNDGDNAHKGEVYFENLINDIKSQDYIDQSNALTDFLHLLPLNELITKLSKPKQDSEVPFEFNIFDVVLNAKIPKYKDNGILTLEYPAVVKLIDIPEDLTHCLLSDDRNSHWANFDYVICLHCGKRLKKSKYLAHVPKCCKHTNIFFFPRFNSLRICTKIGHGPFSISLSAPYLTIHGEVKRTGASGKATLNKQRYKYLNKLWLNQQLYGFATRNLFGSRSTGVGINESEISIDDDDDEDDFDDMDEDGEFIYEYDDLLW